MYPLEHYTKGPAQKMRKKMRKMRKNANRISPPPLGITGITANNRQRFGGSKPGKNGAQAAGLWTKSGTILVEQWRAITGNTKVVAGT